MRVALLGHDARVASLLQQYARIPALVGGVLRVFFRSRVSDVVPDPCETSAGYLCRYALDVL